MVAVLTFNIQVKMYFLNRHKTTKKVACFEVSFTKKETSNQASNWKCFGGKKFKISLHVFLFDFDCELVLLLLLWQRKLCNQGVAKGFVYFCWRKKSSHCFWVVRSSVQDWALKMLTLAHKTCNFYLGAFDNFIAGFWKIGRYLTTWSFLKANGIRK